MTRVRESLGEDIWSLTNSSLILRQVQHTITNSSLILIHTAWETNSHQLNTHTPPGTAYTHQLITHSLTYSMRNKLSQTHHSYSSRYSNLSPNSMRNKLSPTHHSYSARYSNLSQTHSHTYSMRNKLSPTHHSYSARYSNLSPTHKLILIHTSWETNSHQLITHTLPGTTFSYQVFSKSHCK